jgi:hypothetical protein
MKADGLSTRRLAMLTGLGRSRCHYTLHAQHDKRRPLRLDEVDLIIDAVGIDRLEAALANDVVIQRGDQEGGEGNQSNERIFGLLSEMLHGLPEKISEIVQHIDGLDAEDIRREHGRRLQVVLIQYVERLYSEYASRKDIRLEGFYHGNR